MSQAGSNHAGGGGGGSITTIDGDVGSVTGSTIDLFAQTGSANCGNSVKFNAASGTELDLVVTDASRNTTIGASSGKSGMSGVDNIALGDSSLSSATTAFQCVALGSNSLVRCTTADNNICVGAYSGRKMTSGSANTLIGTASGDLYTGTESGNICIGNGVNGINGETNALHIGDTGGTITSAYIAGIAGVSVSNTNMVTINTSTGQLGSQAVPSSLTGYTQTHGTALGINTGATGGDFNVFIGYNAGTSNATASTSTCVGYAAGNFISSGSHNCYFGINAGKQISSGSNNCLFGANAGQLMSSGSSNVIIGDNTGQNYTSSESNNILIGQNVEGVTGENDTLHIGDGAMNPITSTFIAGIAGVTVTSTAAVLVDTSTNQLGTVVSSQRFKDNIQDMGDESEIIYKLRPVKFTWKEHPEYGMQTGLIAEEVHEVAPRLVALDKEGKPASVAYHELPSLLLAEIQRLNARIEALEAK